MSWYAALADAVLFLVVVLWYQHLYLAPFGAAAPGKEGGVMSIV